MAALRQWSRCQFALIVLTAVRCSVLLCPPHVGRTIHDCRNTAHLPGGLSYRSVTVAIVADATNVRGLAAGETFLALARIRRIVGPVPVTPITRSLVASTVDRVRCLRLSRTIGLTGRRVLVLRRGLWTGTPRTILAEIPLNKVEAAVLSESRPISGSIWTARTKNGATITLRNGDVLTVQVYSTSDQGQRKYCWAELRQFEYMLNYTING